MAKENLNTDIQAITQKQQSQHLWQTIGAAKLATRLSTALQSQSIRAIGGIRDNREFVVEGFEHFKDFMDQHPESPMSYDQFNRREKLLNTEGDLVFDLLSSLDVSLKTRTLLAGHIEIEGNEIRVGEERVQRDNEAAILNLITTQYAKLQQQEKKLKAQKDKLKKGEEDFAKLKRKAVIANPTGTPTGQALLTAAGALSQLCEALESASPEEKEALKTQIDELMRAKLADIHVALGNLSKDEAKQIAATADDLISDHEADDLES